MARPRKPVEAHLRDGTYRPDRHGKPMAIGGMVAPPRPRYFTRQEQQLWAYVCADLEAAGILDHADLPTIEGLVCCWSLAREARAVWRREGLQGVGAAGQPKAHWALKLEAEARRDSLRFASALGLSPASRAQLSLAGTPGLSREAEQHEHLGSPVARLKLANRVDD